MRTDLLLLSEVKLTGLWSILQTHTGSLAAPETYWDDWYFFFFCWRNVMIIEWLREERSSFRYTLTHRTREMPFVVLADSQAHRQKYTTCWGCLLETLILSPTLQHDLFSLFCLPSHMGKKSCQFSQRSICLEGPRWNCSQESHMFPLIPADQFTCGFNSWEKIYSGLWGNPTWAKCVVKKCKQTHFNFCSLWDRSSRSGPEEWAESRGSASHL